MIFPDLSGWRGVNQSLPMSDIPLLKIPRKVHSVEEMFGVVARLQVRSVVCLVEDQEGVWVMTIDGTTAERMNWMLDRAKFLVHGAD